MAQNRKTVLSAASLIGEVLEEDPGVKSLAKMVYPVIAPEKAQCPYIVYRRVKFNAIPANGAPQADTALIVVICCTAGYAQGVQLAEAVREALDCTQISNEDLTMRSCRLTDASEDYIDGTHVQSLTFTVKI